MRREFFMALVASLILAGMLSGCGSGEPTQENMAKIRVGMGYFEVKSTLGSPDLEKPVGRDDVGRAWASPDGQKGMYLEFADGARVRGIAVFDRESFTLRQGGSFSHYIVDDDAYRRSIVAVLGK